jgi:hypothetical protein
MIAPFEALAAILFQLTSPDVRRLGQPPSVGVIEYLQEENRVLKERVRGDGRAMD